MGGRVPQPPAVLSCSGGSTRGFCSPAMLRFRCRVFCRMPDSHRYGRWFLPPEDKKRSHAKSPPERADLHMTPSSLRKIHNPQDADRLAAKAWCGNRTWHRMHTAPNAHGADRVSKCECALGARHQRFKRLFFDILGKTGLLPQCGHRIHRMGFCAEAGREARSVQRGRLRFRS